MTTSISTTRDQVIGSTGSPQWRIWCIVSATTDLPTTSIFLFDIEDPADPTQDTFVRVATPYDLDTITVGRVAATHAHATQYLSTELRIYFDELEAAIQAKSALDTRINELISTWTTYQTDFYHTAAPPIYYPTTSLGLEDALKRQYKIARDARISAEVSVAAANVAVSNAKDAVTAIEDVLAIYGAEVAAFQVINTACWTNISGWITTFFGPITAPGGVVLSVLNDAKAAYLAAFGDTYPVNTHQAGEDSLYDAITTLTSGTDVVTASRSLYEALMTSSLNTAQTSARANYAAAVKTKAALEKAVATSVAAKEEAEAALTSALATEAAALADIRNLCPTFDPSSV